MVNPEEILAQLDQCASESTFPMLDNGYIYLAGTKMTGYRDDDRWVLVIEVIGFNYRGGGHNGISNCLHIFGNCLNFEAGIQNENFLHPTSDGPNCNTLDDEEYFYLNQDCSHFILRDKMVPIIHDRKQYLSAGINIEDTERINAFEFLRMLDRLYHQKLVATESEIRQRIPVDIPKILELSEWYHPDLANSELPSENETFKQISEVLRTGDVGFYKPTFKPNTHWTNWPDGGTL